MRINGQMRRFVMRSVAESQAARSHGESGARNVGVIGIACYSEDEVAKRRANIEESYLREGTEAFRP